MGEGRATELIFNRLEMLQAERHQITQDLKQMESEITRATVKRPTAEQICSAWGQITDLWSVLTESERKEVLGGLVQEIMVTQKDRVHLRLSPIASVHGQFIAINSQMGAGTMLSSIYPPERLAFETVRFRFKAFKGGRNRTKVPRLERP